MPTLPEAPPADGRRERLYLRVENGLALPMLLLAVLLVPVLVVPLVDPQLSPHLRRVLDRLDLAIWAAFAAEYTLKLVLAPDRRRFVRSHLPDLALVLLPFLRPVRVLRLARLLRLVGLGPLLAAMAGTQRRERLLGRTTQAAVGVTALAVLSAALLVLAVEERAPGSNIRHFRDALWWAAATVTTTGYGDHYPVTNAGRMIAVILMLVGLALLGVITASIAAALVRLTAAPVEGHQDAELAAVLAALTAIQGELAEVRASLSDGERPGPPGAGRRGQPGPAGVGEVGQR